MEKGIEYNGRKAVLTTSNFQAPQIRLSNFQYIIQRDFDSDLSPYHPENIEIAEQRGLVYDSSRGFYIDEDGCLMRDEFGPL